MEHLGYVGVIWVVFHVLQLLPLRFTQQNLCCTNKSTIKHHQNTLENRTSPFFVYYCHKCMLNVDSLIKYIDPPNCVHYRVCLVLDQI